MVPEFSIDHVVTFDETNLVGNVYFAHYVRWQGHCREHFLRTECPSVARDLATGDLVLVTTHTNARFFHECYAMDNVTIAMSLGEQDFNRATLNFRYLRDGVLVAEGQQGVASLRRREGGLEPVALPQELVEAILRRTSVGAER